jgi:hypothetical protein
MGSIKTRMEPSLALCLLLRRLKPLYGAPWMLIGDFNEAMWSFEQFSSHKRPEGQMQSFRDALEHCDVYDLGFSGLPWTFDNRQKGGRNVKVGLDRALHQIGGRIGLRMPMFLTWCRQDQTIYQFY